MAVSAGTPFRRTKAPCRRDAYYAKCRGKSDSACSATATAMIEVMTSDEQIRVGGIFATSVPAGGGVH